MANAKCCIKLDEIRTQSVDFQLVPHMSHLPFHVIHLHPSPHVLRFEWNVQFHMRINKERFSAVMLIQVLFMLIQVLLPQHPP